MAEDIDYAAIAVRKAILEKVRTTPLEDLQAVMEGKKIAIIHGGRKAEGTRDDLLAAVRKSTSMENLWDVLDDEGRYVR